MELTSSDFLLFAAAALTVYYLLPRRAQNVWLLLVSYLFHALWAWQFALVLLVLTAANYLIAHRLRSGGRQRPAPLWAAIALNLGALLFFRSAAFFVPQLAAALAGLGFPTQGEGLALLLPVGLSYYVLQLISYQLDVYRGLLPPATSPVDFALYLAYFPRLLAGPIERARDFLPQLAAPRVVDSEALARSITLIVQGVVRKLVIADTLSAAIPWDVFQVPSNFGAAELWGWLIVYGFALYNDFAGYMGLARGVSGLFGLALSPNFDRPYFARNFGEFWNRWHITLSHWLRDYVYLPLSRALLRRKPSRRSLPNLVLPPLVTMLASGLWHGFSGHMLLWGGLHGLYQVVERLPSAVGRPIVPPDRRPRWRQAVGTAVVLVLVMLAWVPFRLEIPLALEFWRTLLDWGDWSLRYRRLPVVMPLLLLSACLDWLEQRGDEEPVYLRWPRPAQAALLALALFAILIVGQGDRPSPFIYQGF